MTETSVRKVPTGTQWCGTVTARLLPSHGRSRLTRTGVRGAAQHVKKALPRLVWNMVAVEGGTMTPAEVHTLLGGVTVGGYLLDEERRVLDLATQCTRCLREVEEAGTGNRHAGDGAGGTTDDGGTTVDAALARYVVSVRDPAHRDLASAQIGLVRDLVPVGRRVPLVPRSRAVELHHALATLDTGEDAELLAFLRDCAPL